MPRTPSTLKPLSCARRMRKASEELPKSKTQTISRKILNLRSNPLSESWGALRFSLTVTSFAPMARERTASTAGIRLTSTIVWNVPRPRSREADWAAQMTPRAMIKPSVAPAVSAARCSPKAIPRCPLSMLSATKASRGAVRTPLPTRSAKRTPSTALHEPAK